MSRIVIRILAPYLIGGALLLGACVIGVGFVNRLDSNMTALLSDHVSSQFAAKELESVVHRLRYDHLAALSVPTAEKISRVSADSVALKVAIDSVEATARTDAEKQLINEIRAAYDRFLVQLNWVVAPIGPNPTGQVDEILEPTTELVRLNQHMAQAVSADSQRTRDRIRRAMIVIGVFGPLAGLTCGYAVARSLGRSIHALSINVSDLSAHIGVGESVTLLAGEGIDHVNEQIRHVLDQVRTVVNQMHQQERELIRAEQLASVGQVAAMVAHEIRNPLSAVTILVSMATRANQPVPLSKEDLKVISGELARVEKTVQGMLDLSRPARLEPVTLDLREPIQTGLDLIRRRAGSQKVELDVQLARLPVTVRADRGQLASVFVNLFVNALDEMKSGGRLEVRMSVADGSAQVSVSDTGPGIPESELESVFEPFHSSKPTGTGLGLHIARSVIENHGGSVSVSNRASEPGALFTLKLPVVG